MFARGRRGRESSKTGASLAWGVAGQPLKPWPAGLAVKRLEARSPRGLAYGGCHYQSLDSAAPQGGPGVGTCPPPPPPTGGPPWRTSPHPGSCATCERSPSGPARRSPTRKPSLRPAARSTGSSRRGPSSRRARIEREIADAVASASRTPPEYATTRSPATAARPPGRTTATASLSQLGPAGAQAHHASRRQAHRAGPLHRRRGRTGRVRPAVDGVVRVTDRPATRRPRLPRRARPADQGRARRPRRDYVAEAERMDAPPLASCPVDRYLDAVA